MTVSAESTVGAMLLFSTWLLESSTFLFGMAAISLALDSVHHDLCFLCWFIVPIHGPREIRRTEANFSRLVV